MENMASRLVDLNPQQPRREFNEQLQQAVTPCGLVLSLVGLWSCSLPRQRQRMLFALKRRRCHIRARGGHGVQEAGSCSDIESN